MQRLLVVGASSDPAFSLVHWYTNMEWRVFEFSTHDIFCGQISLLNVVAFTALWSGCRLHVSCMLPRHSNSTLRLVSAGTRHLRTMQSCPVYFIFTACAVACCPRLHELRRRLVDFGYNGCWRAYEQDDLDSIRELCLELFVGRKFHAFWEYLCRQWCLIGCHGPSLYISGLLLKSNEETKFEQDAKFEFMSQCAIELCCLSQDFLCFVVFRE